MKKNNFLSVNLPDKIFGIESALIVLFVPPVILVIIFIISLNLIYVPKFKEIGEIKDETLKTKSEIVSLDQKNKYLASIDKDQTKNDTDYLNSAILKDKKSYLLVGLVRAIASKFNYQIESFSLSPGEIKTVEVTKNLKEVDKIPLNISMYGSRDKMLDLTLALEKSLPILSIDKFETKSTGDLLQINLSISAYFLREEGNIKTDNLTLNDLKMSDEELAVIKKISGFSKIEESEFGTGNAEFNKYTRENPFSL